MNTEAILIIGYMFIAFITGIGGGIAFGSAMEKRNFESRIIKLQYGYIDADHNLQFYTPNNIKKNYDEMERSKQ